MTSGRTENIQHILKSCSVHLKDLASYVSRISDVTNFAMIILQNIFTNVNLNMIKWKILFSVQDKAFILHPNKVLIVLLLIHDT